jgi:hypothetical protein
MVIPLFACRSHRHPRSFHPVVSSATLKYSDGGTYKASAGTSPGLHSRCRCPHQARLAAAPPRALQGEVLDGHIRHGHGVMRAGDGAVYDGQWLHDQRSGRGTMLFPTGLKFEGEFDGDVACGCAALREAATVRLRSRRRAHAVCELVSCRAATQSPGLASG